MNTEQVLTHLNIDSTSRAAAVQQVRAIIEGAPDPLAAARVLFTNLADPSAEFKFTDANEARLTVAFLVENAIKLGEQYDPNDALKRAAQWIINHREKNPWAFWRPEGSSVVSETVQKHHVTVQVKEDGKLKKGSKQILARALYSKNANLDNKALVQLFMKELDMGKAGAQTYVSNCRKAAKG
jgi:hypothetical protein